MHELPRASDGMCSRHPCCCAHAVVHRDGSTSLVSNPTDFPEPAEFASGGRVKAVLEPTVKASIIVPESSCAPFTPRSSFLTFFSPALPGATFFGLTPVCSCFAVGDLYLASSTTCACLYLAHRGHMYVANIQSRPPCRPSAPRGPPTQNISVR